MAIPETDQLAKCSRIGHRQIEPTRYRLIKTALSDTTLPCVAYGKVDVRFKFRLLVTEQFQPFKPAYSVVKLVDRARDLQHQRSLWRNAGWVVKKSQRVTVLVKDGAKTPKDRFQALRLPHAARELQIASGWCSWGTFTRLRRRDRE
ncbi:MAG: hypothetical protein OXP36_03940 [Gammaproteobacteria bacterium]|nr:hypothetical protein [Gammaproteobacteria bacterium]